VNILAENFGNKMEFEVVHPSCFSCSCSCSVEGGALDRSYRAFDNDYEHHFIQHEHVSSIATGGVRQDMSFFVHVLSMLFLTDLSVFTCLRVIL
jgi:hypothetical protein